jgi:hypothetical protein
MRHAARSASRRVSRDWKKESRFFQGLEGFNVKFSKPWKSRAQFFQVLENIAGREAFGAWSQA